MIYSETKDNIMHVEGCEKVMKFTTPVHALSLRRVCKTQSERLLPLVGGVLHAGRWPGALGINFVAR